MPRGKANPPASAEVESTDVDTVVNERPKTTSPEWTEWVLNQLRPNEKDDEGHPNVFGLRRITEEVLGEIIESYPTDFEGATSNNGMRATVSHLVSIQWHDGSGIRKFGAVADCYPGNTDEMFARHAAATADTKAESRALRKALKLKAVSAEEMTKVPVSESGLTQYVVKSQEMGINKLCKDMDINVMAFINSSPNGLQYKRFADIRYTTAQQMLEKLNVYLQNMKLIPEDIRGYDHNWRKGEELV